MPKVTDLTGQQCGPWQVIDQAPTERRVRFWNVEHGCGLLRVLPHAMLIDIANGKPEPEGLCPRCTPGVNGYDPNAFPVTEKLGKFSGLPMGAIAGWSVVDLPEPAAVPAERWATPAMVEAAAALAEPEKYDEHGTDLPSRVAPALADCGERLETYGVAEGLEPAQPILAVVRAAATQEPRPPSRQIPGMSHLGTPCDRKLAARIAEGSGDRGPAWRPFVGTAGHEALSRHLEVYHSATPQRWAQDLAVELGGSRGIIDVLDQDAGTVIDFKFTGVTRLREYARGRVPDQYQGQLDLYGEALRVAGHDVHQVAMLALPLAGEVEDAVWYSRPLNRDRAHRLIARAWRLRGDVADGRPLSAFTIAEDACDWCPLKRRGDCPGMGKSSAPKAPPIAWGGPAVAPPPGV
jgi:hypothetical protein